MRRKKTRETKPFRSHTDINNYNKFLIELDKKQINHIIEQNTTNNATNNATNNIINNIINNATNTTILNNISERDDIKSFIKNIDDDIKKSNYTNHFFTGLTAWDSLFNDIRNNLDPNIYIDKDLKKNTENAEPIKKSVKKHTIPIIPINKEKVDIVVEIKHIGDLLELIEKYPISETIEYNINMDALHKIKEPLSELNKMIGMKDLKENIVDQILFYIQNLHTNVNANANDFMHTVIYGPPGTGKTEIAKLIGSIFSKMGVLTNGIFRKVTRTDLIAGYLGQTALKTRDVIKECLGGVLFIDEAYALGNDEKRDSFSKECIDTLCEALSDHKDNLMVIIAGYETDLNECFFNYNQGLKSRFTWRFKTDEYGAEELCKIFLKKIDESGWTINPNCESKIDVKWFEKNKSHFKSYGRDMETLFAKTKIAHSRRVFCLEKTEKKQLNIKDIDKGLQMYLKNEDSSAKEKEKFNKIISSMYV